MIEYYTEIKTVHVIAVVASGLLFTLRGLLMLAGSRWSMAAGLRYLSYSIDTTLLTAALMLLTILPGAMFANGWLLLKIIMLIGYVVLGSIALKRGSTLVLRRRCFFAAMVTYLFMLSVARAHHPLGALLGLFR